MEIRNYEAADFDAYLRLLNELELYGQLLSADELRQAWALPREDPTRDVLVVVDGGRLAGTARVARGAAAVNRQSLRFTVPPALAAEDAVMDELFARLEARAREIGATYDGPLQLRTGCYEDQPYYVPAFERNGYLINRYYARMDLRELAALPPPDVPAGVIIRPFVWDTELDRAITCMNEGFGGHFEFAPVPAEHYREARGTAWVQPALMFVAERAGRFVGICFNYVNPTPEADGFRWGVVDDLATVPAERGRGLGRALLRHGMLALRERGAARVCLWVDYANPFGAKDLYYSEGFADRYVIVAYGKDGT